MDASTLVIGVIAGAFGTGYFIYGRKQQMIMPMLSGIILCIYPYFSDNIWILSITGITLVLLPFFFQF